MICYGCVYGGIDGVAARPHTCPKTTKPTFRVWWNAGDDNHDEVSDCYGRKYGHEDLEDAVTEHAEYFHDRCDGWDSSWPVSFFVRELSTGKTYEIEVARDFDPVFTASRPREIDLEARKRALKPQQKDP